MIPLADKVERIHRALDRAGLPHAYGGALALAYYATPRATIDIDLNVFVPADRHEEATKVLRRLGVSTFPASADIEREGQGRAWWDDNPIDLFFSYDPVHDAMERAVRTVPFGETTIPILGPEHLLVAKVVFDRPKDWIDIEQMLIAVSDLDGGEVDRWVGHLLGTSDARAKRIRSLWRELRGSEPSAPG